jgi:integrase
MTGQVRPSGHLQVVDRGGGRRWHALWRDADGRHQKILGPAWVKESGKRTPRGAVVWRAANGPKLDPSYLTPAEAADRLQMILAAAPRSATKGRRAAGPRFAAVAAEWLEHGERKRGLKYSTMKDYRYLINNHLLPAFGEVEVRAITRHQIERWHAGYERTRTAGKVLMVLGAILRYAQRRELISVNPIDGVERHPVRYSGDYDIYRREEIDAIVRCAADLQDAAIVLTAALTGLRRGELLALRWRDIDFPGQAIRVRANLSYGQIVTPKSGKVRVVPMVDEVAQRLARLADRELLTGEDDPVFASPLGGHLDGSALRRRFVDATRRADLRTLPFHSLRHFFGSMAVNRASLVQVQTWMGHAHIQTTARYLHHRVQHSDAALLADAFRAASPPRSRVDATLLDAPGHVPRVGVGRGRTERM